MFRFYQDGQSNDFQGVKHINPIKGLADLSDPFLADDVFYLKFEGNNGDTNFFDSSSNGLTVNNVGVALDNSQAKYGAVSARFQQSGTYVWLRDSALAFGTGPYTIEAWVRKESGSNNNGLHNPGSATGNPPSFSGTLPRSYFYLGNVYLNNTNQFPFIVDTWHHVAYSREGTGTNQTRRFLDGVEQSAVTDTSDITTDTMIVGAYSSASYCFDGWIDRFRVTAAARYVADFDPESAMP